MGSKRPIGMEDRFVAYDPKKKTCNPADRNLIKRLAGKQGSETKKRRLRQEKATRMRTASASSVGGSGTQVCDSSGDEGRCASQPLPTYCHPGGALQSPSINRDLLFPQHRLDNLWAPESTGWQSPASHASTSMTTTNEGHPAYTPLASPNYPAVLTPTASSQTSTDYHDYFCPPRDDAYGMPNGLIQPAAFAQPQATGCRAFGSFDSGFQDNDSFDFGFDGLPEWSDSATQSRQQPPLDHLGIEDASTWPVLPLAELRTVEAQTVDGSVAPSAVNPDDGYHQSRRAKLTPYPSPLSAADVGASVRRSSPASKSRSSSGDRRTSPREEREATPAIQSRWASIDGALVDWVQDKERQGQLGSGSASACLDALSECEEARLLWQLNLSRLNPKRVLCPEQPNDIYARAKARLRHMSSGQRLDVEGIMIRIGISEYVAISLVLEVSSLVRDIGTRRDLKVSSSALAIVDHRLAGLSPGTNIITKHLWPDSEGI